MSLCSSSQQPPVMSNAIGSSRESNPSRRICHLRAVPLGHVADRSEIALSKIDPCGVYEKKVASNAESTTQDHSSWKMNVSNAECYTLCNKWIHGRRTKMKKGTCSSARYLICRRCKDFGEGKEEPVEVLCDEIRDCERFSLSWR